MAFACSPRPTVHSLLPEAAEPGATVVVRGQCGEVAVPVEIRWNGIKAAMVSVATPEVSGVFAVPARAPTPGPACTRWSL